MTTPAYRTRVPRTVKHGATAAMRITHRAVRWVLVRSSAKPQACPRARKQRCACHDVELLQLFLFFELLQLFVPRGPAAPSLCSEASRLRLMQASWRARDVTVQR